MYVAILIDINTQNLWVIDITLKDKFIYMLIIIIWID